MNPLDQWLLFFEHNKGYTPATCYNYRKAILRFQEWLAAEKIAADELEPDVLQRYAGEVLHLRGQSPNTRRITVSALRGYYKWLHARKECRTNPAEGLPFPRMGRSLPVPIPADDVTKLMAQADLTTFKGVRDLAILSVLLGCGPRVSGISAMNDGDLVFTRNDQGFEELTLRFREKGRNERYVPAPEETRLMIRAYLGHPDLEQIDRRLPEGDQVLFVNLHNSKVATHEHRGEARRLTAWSIHQMVGEYGKAAGVNEAFLHPHAFRHFYGQELAEHDIDLIVRQQLMGHRDPKSSEIYSHIAFRKIREAAIKANPMRRVKHPATGLAERIRAARRM